MYFFVYFAFLSICSKFKKEAQFLRKFTVQLLNFGRYVKMYHTCIAVPAAKGTLFHAQKMVASLQKPWPANMKTDKKYTINTGQMGKNWMTLFTQDPMAGLFDFTPCIYLNEGELVVNLSEMLIFWTIFFSGHLDNKGCGPKRECQKYLSIFSVIWWRRWPWAPRRRGVRKTCTHGTGSWCWWWNKNPYNISVCHYCRLSTAIGTTERELISKRKE